MPEVKLCRARGCGQYATHAGLCNKHALTMNRPWRRGYPRDQFYASAEWKRTRKLVWERDGYLCQNVLVKWIDGEPVRTRCLKDVSARGAAIAHHLHGWDGPDALDPDSCITVCRECSGKLDGGRRSGVGRVVAVQERPPFAIPDDTDESDDTDEETGPKSIIPPFV